jgi:hypothetical protein
VKKLVLFLFCIFAGVAILFLLKNKSVTQKLTMKIISSAFEHNTKIPRKYTCDGENVNPPIHFLEVPDDAKSLVLIMDDPDAPAKVWVHWVVYNINPQTSEVKENSIPQDGIEGMTDFGKPGYGGPCPPSGTHRYFLKLYALDTALDIPRNATKQMVEEKMQDHIIDKAELISLYSRN